MTTIFEIAGAMFEKFGKAITEVTVQTIGRDKSYRLIDINIDNGQVSSLSEMWEQLEAWEKELYSLDEDMWYFEDEDYNRIRIHEG